MFCFTFVSAYNALYIVSLDHNIDCLMLYSVQLKNMYSRLNSSLKLSDIVHDLSCQQSYCNSMSLHNQHSLYMFQTFPFSIQIMLSLIPSDADDPYTIDAFF